MTATQTLGDSTRLRFTTLTGQEGTGGPWWVPELNTQGTVNVVGSLSEDLYRVCKTAAVRTGPSAKDAALKEPTTSGVSATRAVTLWANQNSGAESGFPPPGKDELVLSIKMGCADTVPFQPKPNTPF